jgi:cellulase
MPSDNSFINDVTSDSLACNGSPVSGFKSSSEVIPVKAGDTVTGNWLHTLTSTGADGSADNKVIDSSHKGPVMAYMKKVDDATQNPSAGPGDGWFKIAEAGLISSSQWAVDALIEAGGVQTVTIPSCIEDGDYLLRFELIALHDGTKPNGAQFYVSDTSMLLSNRAVLTYGFTDGVRPDLGLWRYRWKHTGDCLDPRSYHRWFRY